MLIAEDLALLLAERDAGTSGTATPRWEFSLAGALLIDLAMLDRVGITNADAPEDATRDAAVACADDTSAGGPATGRLVVHDREPTGHPALDAALDTLSSLEGAKPKDAVGALAGGPVSANPRAAPSNVTGHDTADATAHVDRLRAGLRAVLVDGEDPDERTAALIALLTGTDAVGRALGPDGGTEAHTDREAAVRRATLIAEGNRAGETLRASVEEITAVVLAGLLVPTLVAAADGGPVGGREASGGGAGDDHGLS